MVRFSLHFSILYSSRMSLFAFRKLQFSSFCRRLIVECSSATQTYILVAVEFVAIMYTFTSDDYFWTVYCCIRWFNVGYRINPETTKKSKNILPILFTSLLIEIKSFHTCAHLIKYTLINGRQTGYERYYKHQQWSIPQCGMPLQLLVATVTLYR